MKHVNIPIFIPHLGCPNDCIFCNQRSISGRMTFSPEGVKTEIEKALSTLKDDAEAEIAFFGGSFTGIDRELMIFLLDTAQEYVNRGKVSSIRLSTRPDYISSEIIDILSRYSVGNIELGIQSMSDTVLSASRRGHTALDSINACLAVKSAGFGLVGQMMTCLPYSTPKDELETAEAICNLGADGTRIYPTMVFAKTELEAMMLRGEYSPPSLEDAVSRTAAVYEVFSGRGVKILRVGLHSGESLYSADGISAGSYHPAMGELVEGRVYRNKLDGELSSREGLCGKELTVRVGRGSLSKAIGQRGCNREYFARKYNLKGISFKEHEDIKPFDFMVEIR